MTITSNVAGSMENLSKRIIVGLWKNVGHEEFGKIWRSDFIWNHLYIT